MMHALLILCTPPLYWNAVLFSSAVLVAATLAAAKEENAEMDIVNLTPMTFDEMVIDQTGGELK